MGQVLQTPYLPHFFLTKKNAQMDVNKIQICASKLA